MKTPLDKSPPRPVTDAAQKFMECLRDWHAGKAAEAWLLEQLQPMIGKIAREMVSNGNPAETASDHEQTLRIKLLGLFGRFHGASLGEFIALAEKSLDFKAIEQIRKDARRGDRVMSGFGFDDIAGSDRSPGSAVAHTEIHQRIEEFCESLPDHIDQTAMRLVYHYRLPQREIARIVGETEQKISRRLKRLWKELRAELGDDVLGPTGNPST